MPDERRYLQSKFKKKNCNPKFEESYVFQVLRALDMAFSLFKIQAIFLCNRQQVYMKLYFSKSVSDHSLT